MSRAWRNQQALKAIPRFPIQSHNSSNSRAGVELAFVVRAVVFAAAAHAPLPSKLHLLHDGSSSTVLADFDWELLTFVELNAYDNLSWFNLSDFVLHVL